MKFLQLFAFVFGLVVIFVLPLLHIISPRLVSLTQYAIALFLFSALVRWITKPKTPEKSEDDKPPE